jgi:hypothetical protein
MVDRQYDLFEIFPDGSPVWRVAITGHQHAIQKLEELAKQTANEVRAMHLPTNMLIAAMNVREPGNE